MVVGDLIRIYLLKIRLGIGLGLRISLQFPVSVFRHEFFVDLTASVVGRLVPSAVGASWKCVLDLFTFFGCEVFAIFALGLLFAILRPVTVTLTVEAL